MEETVSFTGPCLTLEHTAHIDEPHDYIEPSKPLEAVMPKREDIFLVPIHSLPTEILNEIFQHCVPSWDDWGRDDLSDSLDPRLPPWTLSHICQRWRAQVLDSPNLWSHLEITLQARSEVIAAQQCAEKLSLWMERRRRLPLSIEIVSHTSNLRDHPALPILLESMQYWKQLFVYMPSRAFQCFSGRDLPLLKEVFVDMYVKSRNDVSVDVLSFAPRLCHVGFAVPNNRLLPLVSLPLNQLTNVHLDGALDEDSARQLSQMPELRRLKISVDDELEDFAERIFLPNLSELIILELETAKPGAVKKLFELLVIPQLGALFLSFLPVTGNRLMHFPAFGSATQALTKLCIRSDMSAHRENTEKLLHFLSLTTHVTRFQLVDRGLNKIFVAGMMEVASGDMFSILPRLRTFNIQGCLRHRDLPYSDSWDMLELRCPAVAPYDQQTSDGLGIPGVIAKRCRVATLGVPRWLYHRDDERWRVIRTAVKVICGFEKKDIDDTVDIYYEGYHDE